MYLTHFFKLSALGLVIFACQSKNNNDTTNQNANSNLSNVAPAPIPTAAAITFKTQKFTAKKKESTAEYEIDLVNESHDLGKFINQTICNSFGANKINCDYQKLADEYVKGDNAGFRMETMQTAKIVFAGRRIISIATTWWEYAGGAHGMGSGGHINIDGVNLKVLGIKDMVKDMEGLKKLIYPELKKAYTAEIGGELDMPINDVGEFDDISLDKTSVSFNYSSLAQLVGGGNMDIQQDLWVSLPISTAQPFFNLPLE